VRCFIVVFKVFFLSFYRVIRPLSCKNVNKYLYLSVSVCPSHTPPFDPKSQPSLLDPLLLFPRIFQPDLRLWATCHTGDKRRAYGCTAYANLNPGLPMARVLCAILYSLHIKTFDIQHKKLNWHKETVLIINTVLHCQRVTSRPKNSTIHSSVLTRLLCRTRNFSTWA